MQTLHHRRQQQRGHMARRVRAEKACTGKKKTFLNVNIFEFFFRL
jgi:hypothetical protein